jgi:hypothetical protein
MVLNHSDEIINRWVRQAEDGINKAEEILELIKYQSLRGT